MIPSAEKKMSSSRNVPRIESDRGRCYCFGKTESDIRKRTHRAWAHASGRPTAFALDRLDDGDRATSVGEDDFLTQPDGFDGLGETLVGFTKSKAHVVMILHFDADSSID